MHRDGPLCERPQTYRLPSPACALGRTPSPSAAPSGLTPPPRCAGKNNRLRRKNTRCGTLNEFFSTNGRGFSIHRFFKQTDGRGGRGFSAHRDFAIGRTRIHHVGQTSSRQPRERSEAHPCPSEYIRVNVRYAPAIRVLRVHPFVCKKFVKRSTPRVFPPQAVVFSISSMW